MVPDPKCIYFGVDSKGGCFMIKEEFVNCSNNICEMDYKIVYENVF